jgi:hypothetical protein
MEAALVVLVSRNFWGVMLLFGVMAVLGVWLDLRQNGALNIALLAMGVVAASFFVRPRRGKVALLLVAAALGVLTWSIRGNHIQEARDFDTDVSLMGGDTMARQRIVQEMGIPQVAGSKAETVDRLDNRTLAGFADRYGKAMSGAILGYASKGYPAFYGPACGLTFAIEYKLAGVPGAAPAVWEATRYLSGDFYRVNVPRAAWLDAIPAGKGPPSMEDALKGCTARFSKERQKKMAN